MRFIKNDEPDVVVVAIQMVGVFIRLGRRWPPGSWVVYEPGSPEMGAVLPRRFEAQFTPVQVDRAA